MSELLGFILNIIKPWLGDLIITVDRVKKIVRIEQKESKNELTYDQVIDKIEEIFKHE